MDIRALAVNLAKKLTNIYKLRYKTLSRWVVPPIVSKVETAIIHYTILIFSWLYLYHI